MGLSIFLYPTISDFLVSRKQAKIIEGYHEDVERLKVEEKERLRKEAMAYNEKIKKGTEILDPFSEVRPQNTGVSYMDMLNIGEVMAYVEIPNIDVYLPVYHGTSDDVLNNGLGHIEQTSLPIGGTGTNSVITGHRGLPSAKMFRHLDKMEIGDEFYVHSLDEVLAYEVFDVVIVPPTDIGKLRIEDDKDIVTLITCDPYMINTNRLIVRGIRVDYKAPVEYAEGEEEEVSAGNVDGAAEAEDPSSGMLSIMGRSKWAILILVISVAGVVVVNRMFLSRERRRKRVMEHET
ncbi:MAG TPA: class C sortase [Clostridiaceae bacterium]|nr:class C sortase [Clostridiaceae bacterium]